MLIPSGRKRKFPTPRLVHNGGDVVLRPDATHIMLAEGTGPADAVGEAVEIAERVRKAWGGNAPGLGRNLGLLPVGVSKLSAALQDDVQGQPSRIIGSYKVMKYAAYDALSIYGIGDTPEQAIANARLEVDEPGAEFGDEDRFERDHFLGLARPPALASRSPSGEA